MPVGQFQLLESELILSLFPNDYFGKFLEIGADYGVDHLYPALEKGWTGVYCEPDPKSCYNLMLCTEQFADRVTVINSAVSTESGLTNFYLCTNATGTSSLRPEWHILNKEAVPNPVIRTIVTNTISIEKLFDHIGYDMDIVSIDAEGSDMMLLENIPWDRLNKCRLIMVESGGETEPAHIVQMLSSYGYSKLQYSTNTGNSFYTRIPQN